MKGKRRVVLTGVGSVGWYGGDLDCLAAALATGAGGFVEIDLREGVHRPGGARRAGLVSPGALKEWVTAREGRRMGASSRFALAAARLARRSAEAEEGALAGPGLGISLGTSFGSTLMTEDLLLEIFEDPEGASPFLFTECVANAPAGQIAIHLGAQGPNVTLTQREVGPLLAVIRAAEEIRAGRADAMLAGAVEEIPSLLHALLDRFGSLARPGLDRPELPRPFDARRDGFVASEGASVWLLESEEHARRRGAPWLGTVAGWARAFDPSARGHTWGDHPERLAADLTRALEASRIERSSVELIVSGGSGARRGDWLEGRLLREAFGSALPPLVAPKAVTGEYGGGLLAPAWLALQGVAFGRPVGFEEEDPELGLRLSSVEPGRPSRVLVTSVAAGGSAVWLALDAPR